MITTQHEQIRDMERKFWTDGAEFYRAHLADECKFVFPGMQLDRNGIIQSLDNAPRWTQLDMDDVEFLDINKTMQLISYRAKAVREDGVNYDANISSLYTWEADDAPKLVFHQQTPNP